MMSTSWHADLGVPVLVVRGFGRVVRPDIDPAVLDDASAEEDRRRRELAAFVSQW
ncbi:hypothetical protein OG369_39520 [Streptomyces sp. NBC_01221]|uniref:hypothetical protein n=1 Tax=Streptomyces sp. NBC_01221 TaxID=2903782 RepID=UPI00225911D2|nr:hypothetical protein [Streptomyces sp. NBC_01221]MCX4791947.1 hypothetical protein [Streptomyces sp. NBC_01221]